MAAQDVLKALEGALGRDCYFLGAQRRRKLEAELGLSTDDLLRALVDYSRPRARCLVSDFQVGTAGMTAAGEIFLGVNLEYTHVAFAQTVHAEQFLVSWSRSNSSSPLTTLAVSAAPCGHCRQFMREFDHQGKLRLLIAGEPELEAEALLPQAFTPRDLGVKESFYAPVVQVEVGTDMVEAARRAAACSYTPYSMMRAGAAVRVKDGRIFSGSALENAAYNPGLSPFQAALVACHAHAVEPTEIVDVVLCQGVSRVDYADQARALAYALGVSPDRFQVVEP